MQNSDLKTKSKASNLTTFIQGMVMGVAEIIPGVSGSTFALIMGIYDDFIELLHSFSELAKSILYVILRKSNLTDLKRTFKSIDVKFGGFLVFGMLVAILLFSFIITDILHRFPQNISAFFFGLVLASVAIPYSQIKAKSVNNLITFLISLFVTFVVLGLNPLSIGDHPPLFYMFISGILGITGLILPGVSGSFVLLMLGVYEYVVSGLKETLKFEVSSEKLINIFIFTLGLITGFIFFVRVLKFLLKKYPDTVLATLCGIMIGALRVIYPFFELQGEQRIYRLPFIEFGGSESLVNLGLIFLGVLIIVVMGRMNRG